MDRRPERLTLALSGAVTVVLVLLIALAVTAGGDERADRAPESTEEPTMANTSTPTSAPTSTTSTSTTSTTSTTAPPRPVVEIELLPERAEFVHRGEGEGTARLDDRTVSIFARTSGRAREATRTASLTWTISPSQTAGLTGSYYAELTMEPTWSVNLRTGSNPGRAAEWSVVVRASSPGLDLGRHTDAWSIGSGDERLFRGNDTISVGATVPGDELDGVVVAVELTCRATPGSNIWQFRESSECDARDLGGFTIERARLSLAPSG